MSAPPKKESLLQRLLGYIIAWIYVKTTDSKDDVFVPDRPNWN